MILQDRLGDEDAFRSSGASTKLYVEHFHPRMSKAALKSALSKHGSVEVEQLHVVSHPTKGTSSWAMVVFASIGAAESCFRYWQTRSPLYVRYWDDKSGRKGKGKDKAKEKGKGKETDKGRQGRALAKGKGKRRCNDKGKNAYAQLPQYQ